MSLEACLRPHFARLGARVRVRELDDPDGWVRIGVGRDRSGEFFDIECEDGVIPEVIDVQTSTRHLLLMVRDGRFKPKFLLGRDERHWFAAAVSGNGVHDVRSAMRKLRPTEIEGRRAIRQGEWFFVPERGVTSEGAVTFRNDALRRAAGSKPHLCEETMRRGGEIVMISPEYITSVTPELYARMVAADPKVARMSWRYRTIRGEVYARGEVRHRDHRTIHLECWHRVYMSRENFAGHGAGIAYLD